MKPSLLILFAGAFSVLSVALAFGQQSQCLDGFCIGQGIGASRFDQVNWITPSSKEVTRDSCSSIGCKSDVAFRGYSKREQAELSQAVSVIYGLMRYNMLTKTNLQTLRHYKYECNASPRSMGSERRFMGVYLSNPSKYYTIVGLRLIGGELKVYRIARQYPYHNQNELVLLARKLHEQYGEEIVFYDGVSSNAYSDVIARRKAGWFGRSTMFNPTDLSDNDAELVLIDPNTRPLLQPTSMPESGDIRQMGVRMPEQCNVSMPIQ